MIGREHGREKAVIRKLFFFKSFAVVFVLCAALIFGEGYDLSMMDDDGIEEGIFVLGEEDRSGLLERRSEECRSGLPAGLSERIRKSYEQLGYVLIRGLFDEEELREMEAAGEQMRQQFPATVSSFRSIKFGPIFFDASKEESDAAMVSASETFQKLALRSAVPAFVAKVLMGLSSEDDRLRVLNDVFLAKDGNEAGFCGWHVDDAGFWPCSAHQEAHVPVGVNAWIAINDIPSKTKGGGMAISPATHRIRSSDDHWIQHAYHAIGSTKTHPVEGLNPTDLFKAFKNTCGLAEADPNLYEQFEANKKEFDFRKGDVLLMDRWLWHRSVQSKTNDTANSDTFLRYTIRYESGNTRSLKGFSIHPSILYDETFEGKTLDDICHISNLPFFPKAWPNDNDKDADYHTGMEKLLHVLPGLEARKKEILKEIFAKSASK